MLLLYTRPGKEQHTSLDASKTFQGWVSLNSSLLLAFILKPLWFIYFIYLVYIALNLCSELISEFLNS